MLNGWRLNWQTLKLGWPEFANYPDLCTLQSCLEFCKILMPVTLWCNEKGKHSTNQGWHTPLAKGTKSCEITKFPPECITFLRLFFLCHSPVKDWIGVSLPTSRFADGHFTNVSQVSLQTCRSQFANVQKSIRHCYKSGKPTSIFGKYLFGRPFEI